MLSGLRDTYSGAFLHWRSPLANAGRILRLMLVVVLTTLVSDHFFASSVAPASLCDSSCHERPKSYTLVCISPTAAEALQFEFLSSRGKSKHWLDPCGEGAKTIRETRRTAIAEVLLPTSIRKSPKSTAYKHTFELRLYHMLIFLLFLFFARIGESRWPVFPYRATLRDIDKALASLSSRLTRERGLDFKLGFNSAFSFGDKNAKATDPLDPRTVELLFLRLLRQIDEAALRVPFTAGARISVPVPEVFFVFDELDKLGGRRAATPSPGSDEGPAIANDEERDRSLLLKNLFSDMKNILSSAPARFIFVGGRNLHDEWLADQSSRQPLLTRLFADEIYIPSLLTDRAPGDEALSIGVQQFVRGQRLRAMHLYQAWKKARTTRWLQLSERDRQPATFVSNAALAAAPEIKFERTYDGDLVRDLVAFFTYRSMGNVKRLKELLESFIEQDPLTNPSAIKDEHTHLLILRDPDVHRIQLIADLYRGLLRTFGRGAIWQDDKLAPAVFYVADFLLKFHRRAFTRANLERIDELVHVHRTPELRRALHALVDAWTGTLLHPIRNGMFDFRFRIETGLELRLASRRSDEEMAALNFTLDEAQGIKDIYRRRLAATTDPASFEFECALGELHDLDEEYDLARYRYRRAVHLLDQQINDDLIGTRSALTVNTDDGSILARVLQRDSKTVDAVRRRAHWGVTRLRIMLQIALTHERTHDFESAAVKYRSARMLADALIHTDTFQARDRAKGGGHDLLDHLNLLFQPAFAEAWVSEKAGTFGDASLTLVERAIAEARKLLAGAQGQLFALTLAELHDKAGDLFFFKGKTKRPVDESGQPLRGYLERAQFHYAQSLHAVRAYNVHRAETSGLRLEHRPV